MKKLLSLLTAFSLTAVGASNVIACNKNHTDNGPSASTDIQNLNKIAAIAKEDFDKFLFKKDILGDSSDLSKTYQWVNKDNPSLTLKSENKDQKYVIDYFLNIFQNIFDNTNQKIIDEYPNYYLDSVPLSFDKSDVTIKINFIDLAEIDKKLDLKINNIDKVKAVRVDFDFKYNVNFKTLTSPEEYDRNFNMTNNFDIFEKLNDGTLNYFQDKLINWLDTIKKINLNEWNGKGFLDKFYVE
ncbi:lipoprotein [Spiroplasma endosymbiont of Stenodema calcarata]|uniref:lipoprotein n=1 Tax=Spiroplasma endosymbiont of Stenodema calcarata TaxID=3139328 RepID=UPI003CCAB5A9